MKPQSSYRILLVIVVIIGSLLFLQGARRVSAENFSLKTCLAEKDKKPSRQTNTEFIFFESVTKFLVISLMR